ncbi:sensor histidine kinase [Acetobacter vaccinii]|uniref:histidine kinase n=1 Tax=Acetobacter vaccinii TaxID=2592655 RepID=A0A5C1YPD5_9PROT|nr:ATP-binding protein [Acetobacter vaccinii]QEO17683.1 HAMP domain-containing protein [Acetobacter vaccinii]
MTAGQNTQRPSRFAWLKSVSMVFGLAYGALFITSTLLFLSVIWWSTIGMLEQRTEHSTMLDASALLATWTTTGLGGLAETINMRLAQDLDDDALYLLCSPDGRIIAGNLAHWPSSLQREDTWYTLNVQRDGESNQARLRAWLLPDGYRLLVGRDIRGRAQFQRIFNNILLWTCGVVALLAASGGWAIRAMFRRIIHSINHTTVAITRGDISQRIPLRGAEDELDDVARTINDMLDRICRLMAGVTQVSNNIAHDLRTPITRARAELENAARHARTEDDLRLAIDQAILNLDNVAGICSAMLRVAQIESGVRRSAFSHFDLVPAIQDTIELYDALAEDRGLSLTTSLPAQLPFFGDRTMIQQVVANLLDNAIKFSAPQTCITLSVSLQTVEPPTDSASNQVFRLEIRDRGIGMSAAEMALAPERFFRAEKARTTAGSGLGLTLVQAIVHLHGGTMALADNTPGLVVTLDLPVVAAPPAEDRQSS